MTVYPRRCGEHIQTAPRTNEFIGLSPQVRGTRVRHRGLGQNMRFIPAGAGNTGRRYQEHRLIYGLSPQVRGTLTDLHGQAPGMRFIPAGAGNTDSSPKPSAVGSVYPRRCGEHSIWTRIVPTKCGLSPQVRGTQPCHLDGGTRNRFIPAGAGNTPSVDGCFY